jgi:hypothetical protein
LTTNDRVAALSGGVWGVIAFVIGQGFFGQAIWGGVVAAPVIGVLIGRISRPARDASQGTQLVVALADLYGSAILVGVCVALGLVLAGQRFHLAEIVMSVLWGLTFHGYVLILWPLSFVNHRILWDTREGHVAPAPRIPISTAAIRKAAFVLAAVVVGGFAFWSFFRLIGAGLSPRAASTMPWWVLLGVMGWSQWLLVALLFWLTAPAIAATAERLTPAADGVTSTYGELMILTGIGLFVWPIISFVARMIVVLVKVWLVESWPTEGQVFLQTRFYWNAWRAAVPWMASGLAAVTLGLAADRFRANKGPA